MAVVAADAEEFSGKFAMKNSLRSLPRCGIVRKRVSANERVVVEAAVVEAAEAVEVLTAMAVSLNGVD